MSIFLNNIINEIFSFPKYWAFEMRKGVNETCKNALNLEDFTPFNISNAD